MGLEDVPLQQHDAATIELQPILGDDLPGSTGLGSLKREDREECYPRIFRTPSYWDPVLVRACIRTLTLILIWYFFSTCLSIWNKFLVGKDHGLEGKGPFPAPLLITGVQFACQHFMARFMIRLGAIKGAKVESVTWDEYVRKVLPNGVSTGLDIGLSNYSLVFIKLTFYTMCKSTTPVFLLCFAFLWGIERPSWSLAGVVSIISTGLVLLVYGETQFNLTGFALVMGASMLSGFRWTITQVLLQGDKRGGGHAGGPIEVLYHLTPVMSVTVLLMSLMVERLWVVIPHSPYFQSVTSVTFTGGIMLFGGIIAFLMVWTEFTVIQETSALTFMVAGTFKEIVTVGAAVMFLGEPFTFINGIGLCVLLLGVILFNWTKYRKIRNGDAQASGPQPSMTSRKDSSPDLEELVAISDEEDPSMSLPATPGKLTHPMLRGTPTAANASFTPFKDGPHSSEGAPFNGG